MQLLTVSVGKAVRLNVGERNVLSAIGKHSVTGPVAVNRMGLAGDEQADLSVHGGLDKAVYAYPSEHYPFWQQQRTEHRMSLFDEALPHGFMGENLTLQGLLEQDVWIGDRMRFADCELQVNLPRSPCFKFNAVMGFNQAVKAMAQSGFCGWYLRVVQPGSLQAGEAFELIPGPRHLRVSAHFAGQKARLMR
jgi:MOSC domain-containing protein YiiM